MSEEFREIFADAFDSAVCTAHPELRPLLLTKPPAPQTVEEKVVSRKLKEKKAERQGKTTACKWMVNGSIGEKDEDEEKKREKKKTSDDQVAGGRRLFHEEDGERSFWDRFKKQRKQPLLIVSSARNSGGRIVDG